MILSLADRAALTSAQSLCETEAIDLVGHAATARKAGNFHDVRLLQTRADRLFDAAEALAELLAVKAAARSAA